MPWNGQNNTRWQPDFEQLPDFETLVDQHQSMVFSLAWRMTGDRGLAEELAQDVLLELDRNLHKLRSAEHVRFWLRQVTLHRSADALRRRRANAASLGTDLWEELEERHAIVSHYDPDSGWDSPLGRRMEELLAGLPESQRSALILRYQEDLTPEEIAATLEAPLATVKSQLQRGLKLLRARAGQIRKEYVRGA
jgi:RNA polymerase sigma-70 factor (ECF subfamily)